MNTVDKQHGNEQVDGEMPFIVPFDDVRRRASPVYRKSLSERRRSSNSEAVSGAVGCSTVHNALSDDLRCRRLEVLQANTLIAQE